MGLIPISSHPIQRNRDLIGPRIPLHANRLCRNGYFKEIGSLNKRGNIKDFQNHAANPVEMICQTVMRIKILPGESVDGKAKQDEETRPGGKREKNYCWAQLMSRVFEVDVLACPRCGGRMRILAAIDSADAIEKILACLDLPTRPPPVAAPRLEMDSLLF
jgi:hypothetical protein